jgi:hypothetical protein
MSVQGQEPVNTEEKPKVDPAAAQASPATEPAAQEADDDSWDDKTKAYIKKLRDESAKHRTKAKELETQFSQMNAKFDGLQKGLKSALGIEGEDDSPEEKIQMLQQTNEAAVFESAVLNIALENAIPSDQVSYLKFLIADKAGSLEEGQEIDEEMLSEIVGKVKLVGGKPKGAASSVTATKTPDNGGAAASMTVEQFAKMTLSEKSQLFQKNQKLYDELMTSARVKKLI